MKLESICISLTFIEGIAIWLIVESEKFQKDCQQIRRELS